MTQVVQLRIIFKDLVKLLKKIYLFMAKDFVLKWAIKALSTHIQKKHQINVTYVTFFLLKWKLDIT